MMNLSYLSKAKYLVIVTVFLSGLYIIQELTIHFSAIDIKSCSIAAFVFLISALTLVNLNKLSKDLANVGTVIDQVSQGDFEQRLLNINDKAEMAKLYWSINRLVDRADAYLRESIAAMQNVKDNKYYRTIRLEGMSGSYLQGAQIINDAMHSMHLRVNGFSEITTRFETSMDGVITQLDEATDELNGTAQNMQNIADDTNSQAVQVSQSATVTSNNVQTVSSATEELSSSISQISAQVAMSCEKVGQSIGEITETEKNMNELRASAQTIGEVISMITEIAAQTNLLALNATIEASRAGDAGKGFAVVANEVKGLAAQTQKATVEISGLVDCIQNATSTSMKSFKLVETSVLEVEKITNSIIEAVEQQDIATREIAQSISHVSEGSEEVKSTIKSVSEGAENNQTSVKELMSAAQGIAAQSNTLGDEVTGFLKEVRASM